MNLWWYTSCVFVFLEGNCKPQQNVLKGELRVDQIYTNLHKTKIVNGLPAEPRVWVYS